MQLVRCRFLLGYFWYSSCDYVFVTVPRLMALCRMSDPGHLDFLFQLMYRIDK